MEFHIEVVDDCSDDCSEIMLSLDDNVDRFSRRDRAELEERLRRPGKPDSHGHLMYEKFKVIVMYYDVRRPLDDLKMLGEGLREIRQADLFNRCTSMNIEFSQFEVDIDIQSKALEDLSFMFPYLEELNFIADRTQLPLIFGLGKPLPRLRHLSLWCELTVCDCAYLLKELSDTLVFLNVKRLALPDYRIPTMFPGFRSHLIEGRVRMPTLQGVIIQDLFADPTKMLNKFEMPSLFLLRLSPGQQCNRRGITQKDLKWIPWKNIVDTDVPEA